MATPLSSRTPRRLAALLVAAALSQPALAMEVTINEVQSSILTNDAGGGGSYMGALVNAVLQALEEEAARKARQQRSRPLQPQ